MPPHGWMNDPCAPGYDSASSLYHVNFQWNPYGHVWGNMSWGSATSPDMINWTISKTPSMEPTAEQDQCGVFTGAMWPTKKDQGNNNQSVDGILTSFYTSAQCLPINYRLPYTRGSEKLALAISHDTGKTWTRSSDNIILDGPPAGYNVVSWRDPFVGSWAAIDPCHQYGVISGGLRDETPAIFLYRVEPGPTPKWTFLSSLVNLGLHFCPSRWSGGDFGQNFEVSNFLTLTDTKGKARDVLITSVEGRHEDPNGGELSKDHRQMWMSGPLETDNNGPRMDFQLGGTLDHGCFYAANGFWDPVTGHFVTFGWVFEEDLPSHLVERQGWSGCLSIPRIVSLHTRKGVVGTIKSQLSELTCFSSTKETDGTYTLDSVSLIPDPRLQQRRVADLCCPQPLLRMDACLFPAAQSQLEVDLSFQVHDTNQRVGFDLLHSSDGRDYTRFFFDGSSETLVIDRSQSTRVQGITTTPKSAPHTLFELKESESIVREDLNFHVFFDTSVLEVFVNERVAITTRVYPEEGTCYGVRMYTSGDRTENAMSDDRPKDAQDDGGPGAEVRSMNIWALDARISYVD